MRATIACLVFALVPACNFFDDYLDGEWAGQCTAPGAQPVSIYLKFGGASVIAGEQRFGRGDEAPVDKPKGHWEAYAGQGADTLMMGDKAIDITPRLGECRDPVCHAGLQRPEDIADGIYPMIDAGIYPRGTFFVSVTPPFNTDQLLLYGELDGSKTKLSGPCRWEEPTADGVVEHQGTGTLTKTSSCYLTKGIPSFVCDADP